MLRDIFFDDRKAASIAKIPEAFEDDRRIGNALAQQVVQSARKAGKHRLLCLAAPVCVWLELEAVFLEPAQAAP